MDRNELERIVRRLEIRPGDAVATCGPPELALRVLAESPVRVLHCGPGAATADGLLACLDAPVRHRSLRNLDALVWCTDPLDRALSRQAAGSIDRIYVHTLTPDEPLRAAIEHAARPRARVVAFSGDPFGRLYWSPGRWLQESAGLYVLV